MQVLVEEIDYEDEDSVKQATDLLLQKELTVAQEVADLGAGAGVWTY